MENEFKYQDSLDLFKKIYFKDGALDPEGYDPKLGEGDKKEYWELAKAVRNDGQSNIVGKSAFTPKIVKDNDKYFLTLDKKARFGICPEGVEINSKKNIDITDMNQEEIMEIVSQILNMSNEEIMKMFVIERPYSTKVTMDLLIDDIIQEYFDNQGEEVTEKKFGQEWGAIKTTKRFVEQINRGYYNGTPSRVMVSQDLKGGPYTDSIEYKILTPEETDIDKIRVAIERTNVTSELGGVILQALEERFTEKQAEEDKNEFKYQDSLDYFEQIYYTKYGELRKEDWSGRTLNSKTYNTIGVYNTYTSSGKSKIVGRSAFTPRIVRKPVSGVWQKFGDEEYKYFLTLDSQGKFDDHFVLFYENNRENINEIDITDMSKEDVLNETRKILSMTNEEIIEKFNIEKTYSPQVKLELLLDDIIQEYLIKNGIEIEGASYGPEYGININAEKNGNIDQSHRMTGDDSEIIMTVLGEEGELYCDDRITYKLLSGKDEYDNIRVEIDLEKTKVKSELGIILLDTLRERFTEKQAEKDEAEQPAQEVESNNEYSNYNEYSISRLQSILQQTNESNDSKRKEIEELKEKNELIRKILEAKKEGKDLDAQINELKAKSAEEKQ